MNILDRIIYHTAETGQGTVQYFEKKGTLHLISAIEDVIDLYIVPTKEWKKIQKFFDKVDDDDDDFDFEEAFWTKFDKYHVGTFSEGDETEGDEFDEN